jgi:hypothetical protein
MVGRPGMAVRYIPDTLRVRVLIGFLPIKEMGARVPRGTVESGFDPRISVCDHPI